MLIHRICLECLDKVINNFVHGTGLFSHTFILDWAVFEIGTLVFLRHIELYIYCEPSMTLSVIYADGVKRLYSSVPRGVYRALDVSSNKNAFYLRHISAHYPFSETRSPAGITHRELAPPVSAQSP